MLTSLQVSNFFAFEPWDVKWGEPIYMGVSRGTLELSSKEGPGYLMLPPHVTGGRLMEWMRQHPLAIADFFTSGETSPKFEEAWDCLCREESRTLSAVLNFGAYNHIDWEKPVYMGIFHWESGFSSIELNNWEVPGDFHLPLGVTRDRLAKWFKEHTWPIVNFFETGKQSPEFKESLKFL